MLLNTVKYIQSCCFVEVVRYLFRILCIFEVIKPFLGCVSIFTVSTENL